MLVIHIKCVVRITALGWRIEVHARAYTKGNMTDPCQHDGGGVLVTLLCGIKQSVYQHSVNAQDTLKSSAIHFVSFAFHL